MKRLIPFAAAASGLALAGCMSLRAPGDFLEVARHGSEHAVAEAITAGANTNEHDRNTGRTALMLAAWHNPRPDVITALVKAGADFDARDHLGMTALMYAAVYSRSPKVIEALLDAGADGNALSNAGKNAYHYASDNPAIKGTSAFRRLGAVLMGRVPDGGPDGLAAHRKGHYLTAVRNGAIRARDALARMTAEELERARQLSAAMR